MNRRQLILSGLAAWLAPPLVKTAGRECMPTLFFSHRSPFLARDKMRGRELAELVDALPRRPIGIVIFTPHIRAGHITIAASGIALLSKRRFTTIVVFLRHT